MEALGPQNGQSALTFDFNDSGFVTPTPSHTMNLKI